CDGDRGRWRSFYGTTAGPSWHRRTIIRNVPAEHGAMRRRLAGTLVSSFNGSRRGGQPLPPAAARLCHSTDINSGACETQETGLNRRFGKGLGGWLCGVSGDKTSPVTVEKAITG